jgi:hypothetical protein
VTSTLTVSVTCTVMYSKCAVMYRDVPQRNVPQCTGAQRDLPYCTLPYLTALSLLLLLLLVLVLVLVLKLVLVPVLKLILLVLALYGY